MAVSPSYVCLLIDLVKRETRHHILVSDTEMLKIGSIRLYERNTGGFPSFYFVHMALHEIL